jgi:ankyrin repeat protein
MLLQKGADPDRYGPDRDAPLLIATRAHHTDVVVALIQHGAYLEESDVTGRTALDLARENHFSDIVALLEEAES